MALLESECEGVLGVGMIPTRMLSPNFDLDRFVRDLGLEADFLDNLLDQVLPSDVEIVLKEQVPTPRSDNNIGES